MVRSCVFFDLQIVIIWARLWQNRRFKKLCRQRENVERVRQATVEQVVVKMTRIAALVTRAIVLDKRDIKNLTVPSATKNVIVVERKVT